MAFRKTAAEPKAVIPRCFTTSLALAVVAFATPFTMVTSFVSAAQAAPRVDSWTLAQQAFARLDYAGAYRYSLESLKSNPQNNEARRLAAKSAKELQRYPDCLRLMQEANLTQASTDEVGVVGECAALSQYSPWSLSFLQQNVNVSANHDIASFWLGRFLYRKGDYQKAEKTLKDVAVLPARLEKERLFMLERTREVLRATQAQPPAEKSSDDFGNSTSSPSAAAAPTPKPAPIREPKKEPAQRDSSKENAKRDLNGMFFLPSAQARAGFALFSGKSTPIGPDDQLDYEAATTTNASAAVKTKSISNADLYADARVSAIAGYATPMGSKGLQFKASVEGIGSVTQSNFIQPFYAPIGEAVRPSLSVRIPSKGWSASLGGNVDFALNRNFGVGGFAQYQLSSPGFQYSLTKMMGEGYFRLEFDEYLIKPFANYFWELGQDSKTAGIANQWGTDFKISRIGFLGLSSPNGYPLVRYSRFQPIGRTKSVFLFTQNEGEFWEVNIAPRAYFNDVLNIMTWYRYVTGSRQSYVADSKRKKVQTEGSYRLFQPSSDYNSVASDWTTEVEWTPHKNYSVGAGILMRKLVTTYAEDSDLDNTQQYSTLLDRGGETYNRYFIEARVQF